MKILPLLFLSIPWFLWADPWGKDAELAYLPKKEKKQILLIKEESSLLTDVGKKMIQFHQKVLSPADGPRSHFIPSSSQYTLEAMEKYGFFYGVVLGCDRLMRENEDEWIYRKIKAPDGKIMKWNPVP